MRIDLGPCGTLTLPYALLESLRAVHRDKVDQWLTGLDGVLTQVLETLDAHIVPGGPALSFHLVFFAERSNGEEIVIKCTVPNDEQLPELAAVHALSDAGIGPRLRWVDLDTGVLVMERVVPGCTMPTSLPSLTEDRRIVREVALQARRMARNVSIDSWRGDLVSLRQYTRAIEEVDLASSLWREHRDDVEQALALRSALLAAPARGDVFLHGDLHHYNILRDGARSWRVIDPKGLHGPAGYEFGALTYNPIGIQHHSELAKLIRQRVDIWSEISEVPWESVRSWGYIAAVLSACWSAVDGGEAWRGAMKVAVTIRDLHPLSPTAR